MASTRDVPIASGAPAAVVLLTDHAIVLGGTLLVVLTALAWRFRVVNRLGLGAVYW